MRKEQESKRQWSAKLEELKVKERHVEEETEHKIAMEKLKQDQLQFKLRQADEEVRRLQARCKRLEGEVLAVRDAFLDTSVGRIEMDNVKLRGEVEDLKARVIREQAERTDAIKFRDAQIAVLASELETLRLNRASRQIGAFHAVAPLPVASTSSSAHLNPPPQLATSRAAATGGAGKLSLSTKVPFKPTKRRVVADKASSSLKPATSSMSTRKNNAAVASSKDKKVESSPNAQVVLRNVIDRARQVREIESNPELNRLVMERHALIEKFGYPEESPVIRQFDHQIKLFR